MLTWAFSSPDNPHYLLLIGVLTVVTFHFVETRRHQRYDVWRARVRLPERDVFAAAIDPPDLPAVTVERDAGEAGQPIRYSR